MALQEGNAFSICSIFLRNAIFSPFTWPLCELIPKTSGGSASGVNPRHRNWRWVLVWWGCQPRRSESCAWNSLSLAGLSLQPQPGCAQTCRARAELWAEPSKHPPAPLSHSCYWKWDGKQGFWISSPIRIHLQRGRVKMNFFTADTDWLERWGIRSKESVWSLMRKVSAYSHTFSTVALRKSLQKGFTLLLLMEGDRENQSKPCLPCLGIEISSYSCTLFHLFPCAELHINSSRVSDIISPPINPFE